MLELVLLEPNVALLKWVEWEHQEVQVAHKKLEEAQELKEDFKKKHQHHQQVAEVAHQEAKAWMVQDNDLITEEWTAWET